MSISLLFLSRRNVRILQVSLTPRISKRRRLRLKSTGFIILLDWTATGYNRQQSQDDHQRESYAWHQMSHVRTSPLSCVVPFEKHPRRVEFLFRLLNTSLSLSIYIFIYCSFAFPPTTTRRRKESRKSICSFRSSVDSVEGDWRRVQRQYSILETNQWAPALLDYDAGMSRRHWVLSVRRDCDKTRDLRRRTPVTSWHTDKTEMHSGSHCGI